MSYDESYYKKYEPLFGKWTIVEMLGAGTFGKVFKIEKKDMSGTYVAALKAITIPSSPEEIQSIMSDDGLSEEGAKSYIEDIVNGIVKEFALMSKLKGNSNIVSYEDHEVIPHKDGFGWDIFIRMELLTALPKHIKSPGMTQRDVIKLGIDICRALELCQKHDIIHRDIKPENIFVNDNGDYKLGDFGIARQAEKTQANHTKTGTLTYMAPEVYKGMAYGPSIDIYSLGIVLYKLLNYQRIPFMPKHPETLTATDKEVAIVRRMDGEALLPPSGTSCKELCDIILKACEPDPVKRYSSPEVMREDLKRLIETISESKKSSADDTKPDDEKKKGSQKDDVTDNDGGTDTSKSSTGSSRLIFSGKGKLTQTSSNSLRSDDLAPASDFSGFFKEPAPQKADENKKAKNPKAKRAGKSTLVGSLSSSQKEKELRKKEGKHWWGKK